MSAPAKPPSAFRMEQAMSCLMAARQRLLADDPDIAADETLMHDLLEGAAETGDAMEVLHRVIRAALHAESMADAAEARIKDMQARRDRYRNRAQQLRGAAYAALDALELKRIELPEATCTIAAGRPSVLITDEAALPDEMFRVERKPDKTLIGQALRDNRDVPGAVLSNGLPTLQIRSK